MPYTELVGDPLGQLSRAEEKGWILEDGKRIISFRTSTFQAIEDQLNILVGSVVAGVMLYQIGLAIGHAGMSYSKNRIQSESDLGTVLDDVLKTRGWGRCVELTCKPTDARTTYVFKLKGTPQSYDRTSIQPTCHMMRGLLSGWLEAYLDQKAADSSERECESMGRPLCVFEIGFEKQPQEEK